jgi:hypothetical protein
MFDLKLEGRENQLDKMIADDKMDGKIKKGRKQASGGLKSGR